MGPLFKIKVHVVICIHMPLPAIPLMYAVADFGMTSKMGPKIRESGSGKRKASWVAMALTSGPKQPLAAILGLSCLLVLAPCWAWRNCIGEAGLIMKSERPAMSSRFYRPFFSV